MPSETAVAEPCPNSCNLGGFAISSTFPTRATRPDVATYQHDVMTRAWPLLKPLLAGLLLTLLQLAMAVGVLAPEGSASYRYSTLIQHDSYWFANIVDRGYQTIVPPIDHKDGGVERRIFSRLSCDRCFASLRTQHRHRHCIADRGAARCMGVLDLFLSL